MKTSVSGAELIVYLEDSGEEFILDLNPIQLKTIFDSLGIQFNEVGYSLYTDKTLESRNEMINSILKKKD